MMAHHARRRLIWHGIVLFFLGLLTGFVIPAVTNPRLGLSAHMEALLNGMLLILVGIMIVFAFITEGKLIWPRNVSMLVRQNAYVLILAIGMMLCILTGGNIDLSVGSLVALVGAMSGLMADAERRRAYGAAAREVTARYGLAAIADRWESLFEELAAAKSPDAGTSVVGPAMAVARTVATARAKRLVTAR